MKNITLKTFLTALLISTVAFSQSRVKERQVIGKWKLHMNLKEKVDEETKDESGFGKILAKSIINVVDDLIEEANITFHFKKNNVLEVTQTSLTDEDEETTETLQWRIDKQGRLITSQSSDNQFKFNDNKGWMMKKGKLVPVNDDNVIETSVWMQKVK